MLQWRCLCIQKKLLCFKTCSVFSHSIISNFIWGAGRDQILHQSFTLSVNWNPRSHMLSYLTRRPRRWGAWASPCQSSREGDKRGVRRKLRRSLAQEQLAFPPSLLCRKKWAQELGIFFILHIEQFTRDGHLSRRLKIQTSALPTHSHNLV